MWKRKLTSRKFWLAVSNFVASLAIFIVSPEYTTSKIASLIMMGGTVFAYIIGEGLADAAHEGEVDYNE